MAAAKHYGSDSYGGQVDAWEIWNEPNCGNDFKLSDPAAYIRLLKAAYPAIKVAKPAAYVYAGGSRVCVTTQPASGTWAPPAGGVAALVGSTDPNYPMPKSWDPRDWLAVMYANSAQGYFDGLVHHPYCYDDNAFASPSDWCPSATLTSVYPQYSNAFNMMWHTFASPAYGWPDGSGAYTFKSYTGTSLRDQMAAHGDGSKPIVITEFGAPTTATDGTPAAQSSPYYRSYYTQEHEARMYKALLA